MSSTGTLPRSETPLARATANGTRSESVIDASGTNSAPSAKSSSIAAAASSASRVLPTPPGPVSVSSRVVCSSSSARMRRMSASLPMHFVRETGIAWPRRSGAASWAPGRTSAGGSGDVDIGSTNACHAKRHMTPAIVRPASHYVNHPNFAAQGSPGGSTRTGAHAKNTAAPGNGVLRVEVAATIGQGASPYRFPPGLRQSTPQLSYD